MVSIFHDNAHFSFYFFDKKLMISVLNNNPKLIDELWNYLAHIHPSYWMDKRLTIESLDEESNYLLHYLYETIYDKEFHDEFIAGFSSNLLSFCSIPPITIFLTEIPKKYLLLDHKINSAMVIKNIHHLTKNEKLLPFFKDLYLPQFSYYKNKKYAKILQNLFNYPLQDIDLYNEKELLNSSSYDTSDCNMPFQEVAEQFKLTKNKRTDIEHYLDDLGLCESFQTNYPIFTKNHIVQQILKTLESIPNYSNDKTLFYQNVFDYMVSYIDIEEYYDKRKRNNILHLNNLTNSPEVMDFMKRYYKRTIFEHNNPEAIAAMLKTGEKDKFEQRLLEINNKLDNDFFCYFDKDIDFANIFVKKSIKTNLNPALFKYGESEYLYSNKNYNKNKKNQYNLHRKSADGAMKSIDKLQDYLEKCIGSAERNSFIVSDFANFKYEQRCFFKNGRIIGTTPCARKISFLHCYPNGRIHPYFIDHHNADIDDLKLDRKMAAQMAWFVKAAARDYDKLQVLERSDNKSLNRCGTIDVGYDVDKQEWKIIEIHLFEDDIFSSNAGLYGMNPFLFNNRNIKEVNELNNGTLKINWQADAKLEQHSHTSVAVTNKNVLLIDLLEINDPYPIEPNNLFALLSAKNLSPYIKELPVAIYELNKKQFDGFEHNTADFQKFLQRVFKKYFSAMIQIKMSLNLIMVSEVRNLLTVTLSNNNVHIKFKNTYIDINIVPKQKSIIIVSTWDKSTKLFKFDRYKLYRQKMFTYLEDLLFSHTLYELDYAHKNKTSVYVV